jgi:phosphoglycerate dehydrogenase-like enzyme
MTYRGIWIRPSKNIEDIGITIPSDLNIEFVAPIPQSEEEVIEAGQNVDFVLSASSNPPFGARFFERCRTPKVLQLTGTGHDRVDLASASRHGVPVANSPQNFRSVAQYVFTAIGLISRRWLEGDTLVKQGRYMEGNRFVSSTMHDHGDRNLGIIGLGRIGREVARIGKFFGYHIGYYSRRSHPEFEAEMGVQYFTLQNLLRWSDIIALTVSLTPSTKGLIGHEELKLMKSTAILINAARGEVVDECALARALGEGQIWGAAVDVFVQHPPPRSHPYFKLNDEVRSRLFLTPHLAGRTVESHRRQFGFALENVRGYLVEGKPLECVINRDALHSKVRK